MKRFFLSMMLFLISTQVFALDVVSTNNKIDMLTLEIQKLQQRVESLEIKQQQKKIKKIGSKHPKKTEKKYKLKKNGNLGSSMRKFIRSKNSGQ